MEKQSDTFSEGIAPGGLREKSEIKLLLCYLLKMVDRSLSRSQINDILQEYPIANYFEVNEALNELVKNGTVISELGEKDELFSVTHKTKYEVSSIERSLPRSIREKAVSAALAVLTREKIKNECVGCGEPFNNTCSSCGLKEVEVEVCDDCARLMTSSGW